MEHDIANFSKEIRLQAKQLITTTQIIDILSKLGDPSLEGSYALDLMYQKDLDFHVLVKDYPTLEMITSEILSDIDLTQNVVYQKYEDNSSIKKDKLPKGVYLGFKFKNDWKFDIWFLKEDEMDKRNSEVNEIFKHYKKDKHKQTILELKEQGYLDGSYGRDYLSIDLYRHVILKMRLRFRNCINSSHIHLPFPNPIE